MQSAWRDLGSPSQLTRAQVKSLSKASSGEPVLDQKFEVGAGGVFSQRFDMHENDVWLVEIRPL